MTDAQLPPSEPTIDIVAIGNALVDIISHGDDALLDALAVPKGSMTLIEADRVEAIYSKVGPGVEVSGGSAANTIVGAALLGSSTRYIGRVRDDQLGNVFAHDLRATGVAYDTPPATSGASTGCCFIIVTPDAQRTMNTYLGASVALDSYDVDLDAVRSAKVLYLEGYLFDPPEAQAAFRTAARIAREAGRTVALTLSDSFCVDRHREAFVELLAGDVDLLFANEAEILSLYQVETFEEAADAVRAHGVTAALTRSEKGSVVVTAEGLVEVQAAPVDEVIDTTGAGDLYASGFLHGFAAGLDLATCAALGSVAAAEVISHVGARPEADLRSLAGTLLDGID